MRALLPHKIACRDLPHPRQVRLKTRLPYRELFA